MTTEITSETTGDTPGGVSDDVRRTIAAALGADVDVASVHDDSGPGLHERWDSLATIAVVAALEDLVGRQLDLDELAFATTVAHFAAVVRRARASTGTTTPSTGPTVLEHPTAAAAPAAISTMEAA